jgi:hypothetical protein
VLALALALSWRAATAAEQPIILHSNPSDAEWHFLLEQLGLEGTIAAPALADDAEIVRDRIADLISRGIVVDQVAAIDYIRDNDVSVAWADLTGDGVDEAIIALGFGIMNCGTAGCDDYVLQRQDGGWAVVAGIGGVFPDSTLCYEREGMPLGATRYPLLRSASDAIWWTGTGFHNVCYRYCQGLSDYKEDFDTLQRSLAAEELFLPERLRERPWCAPPP